MHLAEDFIKCFCPDAIIGNEYETDLEYSSRFTASVCDPTDIGKIQDSFQFLQNGDSLSLAITFGNANPITFQSSSPDFNAFIDQLNSEYSHQEGETIIIDLTINKSLNGSIISIYHFETFISNLEQISAEQAFVVFSRMLLRSDAIICKILNLTHTIATESLYFQTVGITDIVLDNSKRQIRLESVSSISNYANSNIHKLLPEDFKIISSEDNIPKLTDIFKRFSTILSVLYLFDITSLEGNILKYKLNGYKSINGSVDVNTFLNVTHSAYYDIYKWVFNGGNLNDKIGLARNIISLHLENENIALKGEPLASIQSGYKVYEKQNIKQYIEIRNKLSDQLIDFNTRANKVIETFAIGFQKSSMALITFFFSSIAIKIFSTGDFDNVFSFDMLLLTITFIVCTCLYFLVARWEVKAQRERFVNSYTNLKERYTDILDKSDVSRILNGDKEYNEDLKFIDDKLSIYTLLWLIFLGLLLIAAVWLHFLYIMV